MHRSHPRRALKFMLMAATALIAAGCSDGFGPIAPDFQVVIVAVPERFPTAPALRICANDVVNSGVCRTPIYYYQHPR